MLDTYLTQTRDLLNDPNGNFFSSAELTGWINIARNRIAAESESIRVLVSGGSVTGVTLTNAGTNYSSNPIVEITPPTAIGGVTATATISGPGPFTFYGYGGNITFVGTGPIFWFGFGSLSNLTLLSGGSGYSTVPTATVVGGGGSGATVSVDGITPPFLTTAGQSVYPFSLATSSIQALLPGANQIIAVQSVTLSWGTMAPVLQRLDFTAFQGFCRSYTQQVNTYPLVWCQYEQGANGTIMLWPAPIAPMVMFWDCYCTPIPLVDDTTVEAILYPWTDVVPYYAAYYAYLSSQNKDMATVMMHEIRRMMPEGRSFSQTSTIPDLYVGDA